MPRPCRHGRDGLDHDLACAVCRMDLFVPKYTQLWSNGLATPTTPGVIIVPSVPCPYERGVVEFASCDCELKHVRICVYEGPDYVGDRCTRGPNNGADPGIVSCVTCKYNPNTPTGTRNV